jgi:hypothetical protein
MAKRPHMKNSCPRRSTAPCQRLYGRRGEAQANNFRKSFSGANFMPQVDGLSHRGHDGLCGALFAWIEDDLDVAVAVSIDPFSYAKILQPLGIMREPDQAGRETAGAIAQTTLTARPPCTKHLQLTGAMRELSYDRFEKGGALRSATRPRGAPSPGLDAPNRSP